MAVRERLHRSSTNPVRRARQPRMDGYNVSFNGKLRDELLDEEIFYKLSEIGCMRYLKWLRVTSSWRGERTEPRQRSRHFTLSDLLHVSGGFNV